uniref:Uncharacterized protein n=1 Tax=Leersia perrieri TaxID=77586 RepID=A0A0D9WIA1_9ORYZ
MTMTDTSAVTDTTMHIVITRMCFFRTCSGPKEAELLACEKGLRLAAEWVHKTCYSGIGLFLSPLASPLKWECNRITHDLAQFAKRSRYCTVWQCSKKLRVLLIPFFATSHIGPYTDLAVRLAAARPDVVEPTIAVTPANVSVVQSALKRHGSTASSMVSIATYPFPDVAGLPPGIENLSTAGVEGWRIDNAAVDEALTRPPQEALIRDQSPDALITDVHFSWNAGVAEDLAVPCVSFLVVNLFSELAMRLLDAEIANDSDAEEVTAPGFPGPKLRIPSSELPEFLTCQRNPDAIAMSKVVQGQKRCHGVAVNTFLDMEQPYPYHEKFVADGFAKRAYLVGPLCLPHPPAEANVGESSCINWLDSKPHRSVVYICFGSFAPISHDQLDELALGLEASGESFLWAVRADGWSPPAGWEDRVGERGMLIRGWVPQTAILAHPSTAAFMTHCGSSSLLEAISAGVPLLTWPLVFDQFIEERLVTDVLQIGERVWDGPRSVRYEEKTVVPAAAVAQTVSRFLEPGGRGEVARVRAQELAIKAHAAVAEGGSSYNDLRRLIDDLVEARTKQKKGKMASADRSKKLRVVLIPFFATSHIGPFTDFAVRLATARPANVPVVWSLLERHAEASSLVAIATYPFPAAEAGLPPGVKNLSNVAASDAWRIDAAATDEKLMRPAQEHLIRELSPDAIITDAHFFWNASVAGELDVPCVQFYAIGAFSTIAMAHIAAGAGERHDREVTVPRLLPAGRELRIPTTELPEFLRSSPEVVVVDDHSSSEPKSLQWGPSFYFGVVVNTFFDLESEYCEMYTRDKHAKRAYFVGSVSPSPPPLSPASSGYSPCLDWLSSKPTRSVVYVCFGSLTHVSDTQLDELALGLEASGKPFLWVVRTDRWDPPKGWSERVRDGR